MLPSAFRFSATTLAVAFQVFAGPVVENELAKRSNNGHPPTLVISGPSLTSKWIEGSDYTQIIQFNVTNTHKSNYATLADTIKITASSSSLKLVVPATIDRLAPGQSQIVQVGVQNNAKVARGTPCSGTLTATWGGNYGPLHSTTANFSGSCGFGDYTASSSSLAHHLSPDWYDNVKFGIFIHWGLYSAPAYGNVAPNEAYAEWYWNAMHDPNADVQTYQYHNETYGESFNYDDFMSNFTAANWNPKTWVDLIAASGAQYMVPVTKHHDGFALFNFSTSISLRSSIHYGPMKRDFIGDLLNAAKTYHPHIRRGTYFSLPEWYNPSYKKYAYNAFPGGKYPLRSFEVDRETIFFLTQTQVQLTEFDLGPPVNPYTNAVIPYTGYVEVNDFIQDIQLPQQNTLAYDYDTEIMWCDIAGSPNNATIFASAWINWARDQGRQVAFNSRCGLTGDFDTPEYSTYSTTRTRKWETNLGMDPNSFGYNYQTPDSRYKTGEDIVLYLVDTVSKNGNFLLDIGPKNDGTIPQIMQTGLRDAGTWIHAHSESIFNTTYWATKPGSDPFRYTTTANAFYIHINSKPSTKVIINDPIPYLPGDTVTVVGGSKNGTVVALDWNNGNGTYFISLTDEIIAADQYVWTFKLAYTSNW